MAFQCVSLFGQKCSDWCNNKAFKKFVLKYGPLYCCNHIYAFRIRYLHDVCNNKQALLVKKLHVYVMRDVLGHWELFNFFSLRKDLHSINYFFLCSFFY